MALSGELAKYIGNEMIKTGGKELAKAGAKSALSSLIPSVATKARTATLGGLMSKVVTSGFSPTVVPELERKITVKSKDSILNSVIPVKTDAYRLNQLRDAYEGYVGFKKNNIEKYDKFIDTLDKSDPLAMSQKSYDEIIGKILGQDTYNSMMNIKNYAGITSPEKFDKSKASMKSFLASDKSEKIRSISQKLYPVGTKVYRYKNSPDGISYTNNIENALKNNASNDVDDMENIEEYMLKEGDRIIAPEFVERGNTGAPGSEFIIVKKEDLPKGRGWWRNNQNNPHVAKPIRNLTDKDAETLYKYTKKMPDLSDDSLGIELDIPDLEKHELGGIRFDAENFSWDNFYKKLDEIKALPFDKKNMFTPPENPTGKIWYNDKSTKADKLVIDFLRRKNRLPSTHTYSAERAGLKNREIILKIWKPFYEIYRDGIANKDNFFMDTIAEFQKRGRRPNRPPDYVSKGRFGKISSEYWYSQEGVIRGSDHWGEGIASCDWFLGKQGTDMHGRKQYGFAKWEDFTHKTRVVPDKNGEKEFMTSFSNTIRKGLVRDYMGIPSPNPIIKGYNDHLEEVFDNLE